MSKAVVLTQGLAEVSQMPATGMLTIRADLSDPAVIIALTAVTGTEMPGVGQIVRGSDVALGWMSPDEALLLCAHGDAPAKVSVLEGALAECHALVVNVSDARAYFTVTGAAARDVLGKLTPADLRSAAFADGTLRRTRLAQVAAALWAEGEQVHVVCFRSVADYVAQLLRTAADADAPVGWHG
ncbi:sarcosine oxidase subunit gamma [Pseudaestuariivita sp.]|uniref:sarcosine oxidase subunit gamma n=1 Tax=Pseudaestuariivita sp. TaxID=2211669 RepID=UPI0040589FD6